MSAAKPTAAAWSSARSHAYGRLHVAFNNAGIGASGFAVADEEEVTWSRLIDVNLKGIFLAIKPAGADAGIVERARPCRGNRLRG